MCWECQDRRCSSKHRADSRLLPPLQAVDRCHRLGQTRDGIVTKVRHRHQPQALSHLSPSGSVAVCLSQCHVTLVPLHNAVCKHYIRAIEGGNKVM